MPIFMNNDGRKVEFEFKDVLCLEERYMTFQPRGEGQPVTHITGTHVILQCGYSILITAPFECVSAQKAESLLRTKPSLASPQHRAYESVVSGGL
jgi:hypothetical protein